MLTLGTSRNSRAKTCRRSLQQQERHRHAVRVEPPEPHGERALPGHRRDPVRGPEDPRREVGDPAERHHQRERRDSHPTPRRSSTRGNSSIVPETRLISLRGHDHREEQRAEHREHHDHADAQGDRARDGAPGVAGLAGVEARHLHAGEEQDDPAEERQVVELDVGHQRAGRERDLARVALGEVRDGEDHESTAGMIEPASVPTEPITPDAPTPRRLSERRPQKNAEHDDDEVELVRSPATGRSRTRARGHEREHGREPGDVLGVVAPHGEEPGRAAERLLDPGVDAAVPRPARAELGSDHRDRHEEHHDRQREQRQHRPAVLRHHRQVSDADDRRDVDHREGQIPSLTPGRGPIEHRPRVRIESSSSCTSSVAGDRRRIRRRAAGRSDAERAAETGARSCVPRRRGRASSAKASAWTVAAVARDSWSATT